MNMMSHWFVILNYCICLSLCHADICKNLTYAVKDENKSNYCIECRICPDNRTNFHNQACKEKIPQYIPGQGHAWCTSLLFPVPNCSSWNVFNGQINCTGKFNIMSKCNVICDRGYTIVNPQSVECTESLQWNVSEHSRPRCNRTDPPGEPNISSSTQHSKVKVGTTVTLTCKNTTELVGEAQFIWIFNNNDLYNIRTQPAYQLVSVMKTDEGSYRCVITDDLGVSLPHEYKLDVESESIPPDEENKKLLLALLIILLVAMITALFVIICCRRYLKEKIISCFKCRPAQKWDSETTSSTDTIDKAKMASQGKESIILVTNYTSGPDDVSKVYSTKPRRLQHKDNTKNSSDSPLLKKHSLTETANSNQRALRDMMNNQEFMKIIKKCIDQIPDSSKDKPTYRDLAKFLGMEENEISNFEFICKQEGQSPTEKLLHIMRANGYGIDRFLSFLKSFNICGDLVKIIQHYNLL